MRSIEYTRSLKHGSSVAAISVQYYRNLLLRADTVFATTGTIAIAKRMNRIGKEKGGKGGCVRYPGIDDERTSPVVLEVDVLKSELDRVVGGQIGVPMQSMKGVPFS